MPRQKSKRKLVKRPKATAPSRTVLIDIINPHTIRKDKEFGDQLAKLEWELFASLAHQRSLLGDQLNQWVQGSATANFAFKDWRRIVTWKYTNEPLSLEGSLSSIGGRFNIGRLDPNRFPEFPSLYIADSEKTAYLEKFGHSPDPGISPEDLALANKLSYTSVTLSGQIDEYLDLRKHETLQGFVDLTRHFKIPPSVQSLAKKIGRKALAVATSSEGLYHSMMDPNWRIHPQLDVPSNSQILGQIVYQAGLHGIIYPSTKNDDGVCLALFPQNFRYSGSYVELTGEIPSTVNVKRYDRENLP